MELNDNSQQSQVIAKAAIARVLQNVRQARTDFKTFVEKIWANDEDFKLAPFHEEAIEAYTNPAHRFVYWEAHRGSGKSLITSAFVVWSLGQDANHRIKLICANDKEARKRLFEIKEQIEKNPLVPLVFPHLKRPKGGVWNKGAIVIERENIMRDPSIEALGVMSGALGSRSTLIVLDDVVDLRNSVLQPLLKEAVRQKVFGEIVPLLEKEGRFLAVGTPWTLTDVNAIMKESDGFHLIGPHPVGDGKDLYAPIWDYKFTRAALKQLRDIQGPAEYARAYLCQALTKDTVPIQPQWIKFYDAHLIGDPYDLFCIQTYDLALEQSKTNDWFANLTVLWDKKRNYIFVTDGKHDRISFDGQVDSVIGNAKLWNPQEVVIEKGGYQGALASHLEARTDVALPIWQFSTKGRSKERRLMEVTPLIEKGRVFFHPKFDPRSNPDIAHTAPIIEELISFPFGKWDDFVDCLSMALLTIIEMAPDINQQTGEEEKQEDVKMTIV
jgi:phage terminase large subunit-like protein